MTTIVEHSGPVFTETNHENRIIQPSVNDKLDIQYLGENIYHKIKINGKLFFIHQAKEYPFGFVSNIGFYENSVLTPQYYLSQYTIELVQFLLINQHYHCLRALIFIKKYDLLGYYKFELFPMFKYILKNQFTFQLD
jgi:hypothetical protein